MDEIYVTYVDDEHVDNHDYDDTTDDDHDNNNDICGHIATIIYFRTGPRARPGPDPGRTGPDQAGPSQTSPKYIIFSQNIESTIVYNPG